MVSYFLYQRLPFPLVKIWAKYGAVEVFSMDNGFCYFPIALFTETVRGSATVYHGQVLNLAFMGAENEILEFCF